MDRGDPFDLLSALPVPALTIGPDDRIGRMNTRATTLLGAGLPGRHYITALRQPAVLEAVETARLRQGAQTANYHAHDGDRDTTWTATVAQAHESTLLVTFEDRTEAEDTDQMRRDFVANVSHELRTPLTALIGYIETLQGPARDDPAARDRFLATMADEAQRMNRLVSDLLSLSRVEADVRVRPTGKVDIGQSVTQAISLLAPLAEEAGGTVNVALPDGELAVVGDADQLRQVFVNLIENAIKYGGRHIRVEGGCKPDMRVFRGPGLRVDVIDDGPGLDPVHLPRLTQRFYRVDTHRSREVGGTGLGLAIVKHILSRHRGRLRIASRPGQGSRFSVLLPLKGDGAVLLS